MKRTSLSIKDIQFIIKAIEMLIEKYQRELKEIEEEEKESELSNDCMYLICLREGLKEEIKNER